MPGITVSFTDKIYLIILKKAKDKGISKQDIIREIVEKEFNNPREVIVDGVN